MLFETNNINYIDLHLLEGQVDIILRSLELYAFNFHNVYAIDVNSNKEDLRNALLFHTYNEILSNLVNNKYRIGYDVTKECKLKYERKRKIKYYNKNIA